MRMVVVLSMWRHSDHCKYRLQVVEWVGSLVDPFLFLVTYKHSEEHLINVSYVSLLALPGLVEQVYV